jgi:hypothetical protein
MAKNDEGTKGQEFDRVAADAAFDEAYASAVEEGLEGLNLVHWIDAHNIPSLTIKQVALVTGLDPFTVRTKSRKGGFSKSYDVGGRVQIPTGEVVGYMENRGTGATRDRRRYVLYMTSEEASAYASANPDSGIRMLNDPAKREARKAAKAAEASKGK